MSRIILKKIFPFLCVCMISSPLMVLTGCSGSRLEPGSIDLSSEEKKDGNDARSKLELFNIGNDLDMFIQFSNKEIEELQKLDEEYGNLKNKDDSLSNEELAALFSEESTTENEEGMSEEEEKKLEKKLKSCIVIDDYIANIYQLALSRLSADIEHIYTSSEEYMAYIGLLQNFADTYTKNEENFRSRLLSGDMTVKDEECFKSFLLVEDYYIDLYRSGHTE